MGPPVLDLTAELVAIDSQNPGVGEKRLAGFVAGYARERGLPAKVIETAPGRCNVLITIDAGDGPHLALSGHLDTKPIGDAYGEWRTPPLELVVDGDLAYGLGASDMKGAVAAMLRAAESWSRTARRGRLSLILTADEEAGSDHGAKALSRAGLVEADAIVIGEPSGVRDPWEALYVISRGICCFEVVIRGRQGHSGLSERLPTSATVAAARATTALAGFRPAVARPSSIPCEPTVNPAVRVSGGVFYGVHPGDATVATDIRLVPGMDRDRLDGDLRDLLTAALPADVDWTIRYAEGSLGWMDPSEIAADHPVVAAAQAACADVLGRELPLGAYPGGTDATHFTDIGGVPAITALGPGWLSVAHGPNECVGVSQLAQAEALYERLARVYLEGT
ncbi:M20 family metallopeptidase [Actinoallomurus sp. NBC_01490]|uniref:M20 family metallopeptidase n=1 Tax=Actinoallomurus sp. NBC_01490 TaxID=2903557 RepID=UPI002E35AA2C|nr:M20 family metallopeptidase [Actinoallomurus sp. NBC_01490]